MNLEEPNNVDKGKGVEKPEGDPAPLQLFERARLLDNESRRIREFRICIQHFVSKGEIAS